MDKHLYSLTTSGAVSWSKTTLDVTRSTLAYSKTKKSMAKLMKTGVSAASLLTPPTLQTNSIQFENWIQTMQKTIIITRNSYIPRRYMLYWPIGCCTLVCNAYSITGQFVNSDLWPCQNTGLFMSLTNLMKGILDCKMGTSTNIPTGCFNEDFQLYYIPFPSSIRFLPKLVNIGFQGTLIYQHHTYLYRDVHKQYMKAYLELRLNIRLLSFTKCIIYYG